MPDFRGRYAERRAAACAAPTSRRQRDRQAARRSTSSAARRCSASSSATSTRSRPSSPASPQADGIPVRVVNYGRLAYVNWQETLLLEQLARRGALRTWPCSTTASTRCSASSSSAPTRSPRTSRRSRWRQRLGLGQRGPRPASDESRPRAAYDAWADVSLVHRLGEQSGLWSTGRRNRAAAGELDLARATRPGDRAARRAGRRRIYARGVGPRPAASRPATASRRAFFWQPFLYSKRSCRARSRCAAGSGTDPDAWRAADAPRGLGSRPRRGRRATRSTA